MIENMIKFVFNFNEHVNDHADKLFNIYLNVIN